MRLTRLLPFAVPAALAASLTILLLACAAPEPKKLTASACEELWGKAEAALRAFDEAHRDCATAADCAGLANGACGRGCGAPVARGALAERQALERKLGAGECATWKVGGCESTTPKPMPSCVDREPVCVGGKCQATRP